jgi:hypothetical protein
MTRTCQLIRTVRSGTLTVGLGTGAAGEVLYLLRTEPIGTLTALARCPSLPTQLTEIRVGAERYVAVEPIRGRSLASLQGRVTEAELMNALFAAAQALWALEQAGCFLPRGSLSLETLVKRAGDSWGFDLTGALLHHDAADEGPIPAAEAMEHLARILLNLPQFAGYPRLQALGHVLERRPLPTLSVIMATIQDGPRPRLGFTRLPTLWAALGTGLLVAGVALVVLARASTGPSFTVAPAADPDRVVQSPETTIPLLLPWTGPEAQAPTSSEGAQPAQPKPAPRTEQPANPAPSAPAPVPSVPAPQSAPSAPAPAPERAPRPSGHVNLLIKQGQTLEVLRGWATESGWWVRADDLIRYLSAQEQLLPSGNRQLSWQFGRTGIAVRISLETTDGAGARYLLLTPGMMHALRLHEESYGAFNVYFTRDLPE